MLFFTICCNNYLAQAITLGNSIMQNHPDSSFFIGLVDKIFAESHEMPEIPYPMIELEQLGIPELNDMVRNYSLTELSTAVKPFYFKHFIAGDFGEDCCIYLDPDIKLYSRLEEIENALAEYDIILTPHCNSPISDDKLPSENEILNSGLYNLGFIGIKNTNNSERLLSWWGERLKSKAYIDFARGMFTDQIWINFVPLYFERVKILSHPGYNMAYWNLHERFLSVTNGQYSVNGNYPLAFYHFSGFDPECKNNLSKYQNRFSFKDLPEIRKLFSEYSRLLFANGYELFSRLDCSYAGIRDGYNKKVLEERIRNTPYFKRIIRKIILKIIRRYRIPLDYSDPRL